MTAGRATVGPIRSKVLRHPRAVATIVRHTPTLDPLAILLNSDLYYLTAPDGSMATFVTIKRMGGITELGTVYTYPAHRGQGLSTTLLHGVLGQYTDVYLLCKPGLEGFYGRIGFALCGACHPTIIRRRDLFNTWLGPLLGHRLVAMRRG
jgi:hypothetical protein